MPEALPEPGIEDGSRRFAMVSTAEAAPPSAAFHGRWDVRRIMVDHLSGAVHHFTGTVIVTASTFVETGMIRYGAISLKAERRYVLEGSDADLGISFSDGRPFIHLDGRAAQTVRHLCGDDDYRGRFFFRNSDAWLEAWRVLGPRKRYASLARYRRHTA